MVKFPARLPRSRLEKPRSREPSQAALSYEHIENFTKDLEVRRDLGNRASPANRAHMKRPLVEYKRAHYAGINEFHLSTETFGFSNNFFQK